MKQLTKIEQLDHTYPGLADSVRNWFNQGITAEQIVVLLSEEYHVSVTVSPISRFRRKRWAPERERIEEKRIEALAALEVARAQKIRESMAFPIPGKANESSD
jgi:ribulose bisphosphate carboxylase small subunit